MSTSTPYRSQTPLSSTPAGKPPTSTTLTSLLAQANSLNSVDHDPELPQIRFGIDEIERMSEQVAGRGKRTRVNRGEGHNLLSNLGINTSQLTHTISQLPTVGGTTETPTSRRRRRPVGATKTRLEPLGDLGPAYAMGDGDVGAWGRNWHEMVILSGIEVQRQRTIKSFQTQFQQRMLQNWEAEKARVLQDELGVTDDELAKLSGSSANGAGLVDSSLGRSRLGSSVRRFPMAQSSSAKASAESREGSLVMHNKMVKYEQVVSELNRRRLRKEPYEICQALGQTVKGDSKYPLLPIAYNLLAHLTNESSTRDNPSNPANSSSSINEPVEARQFAKAYLGDQMSKPAVQLRGKLVAGGKRFLEGEFETHIDEIIAKHPKEAALGGIPGITNKVRAFVDVTLRHREIQETYKPETVDGIHLWAQVYYLLRAGYSSEALELITNHQSSLKRDDYTFPGAFKSYLSSPDHRIPKQLRDQLSNDFNSHIRSNASVDQFKYALYKLVGRLELSRKSVKVAATTEDWMWFQLCLVREATAINSDPPADHYDLAELGRQVVKFGSDKFDSNGTRPFAWFNLLLYTGQFERAVAYLDSKSGLKTDAVHFAIALQYYGLLRIPSKVEISDLLTVQEIAGHDQAYLNFPRLIKQYIKPFSMGEPQTALQYAYLVSLASDAPGETGARQQEICLDLVRDIVLSSRSWSKLLGTVRADGSKETGVIERDLKLLNLANEEDYLRQIVIKAADQANSDASLTDSIELYHLAGSYDKVIETVNKALGHSLGSSGQTSSTSINGNGQSLGLSGAFGGSDDLRGLALRVKDVYERDHIKRSKISRGNWEILEILLKLQQAMTEFIAERPDLALETFKSTSLLPLDNDPSAIPRYINKFKDLLDSPSITNLDEIIVTAMKCLHQLSQQLKQSPYGDHGRMALLNGYKHQAQCLIQFASGLRLRLGPDVYRQLSSMSAFF